MTSLTFDAVTRWFPVLESENRPAITPERTPGRTRGERFFALEDMSFSVQSGETVIIAGANGSGKSVLAQIACGLQTPSSGKVTRKGNVGLVFQDPDAQILGETPLEDVSAGLKARGFSRKEAKIRAFEALCGVGLRERAEFPARFLSGGEKRRLALAGILVLDAEIIIFDEPYTALDLPGVIEVNRQFKNLQKTGKTLLIISHELEKCLPLSTRFLALREGHIVLDTTPEEALRQNLEALGIHNPSSGMEKWI